jgi:hypothetical protein
MIEGLRKAIAVHQDPTIADGTLVETWFLLFPTEPGRE